MNDLELQMLVFVMVWIVLFSVLIIRWSVRRWTGVTWPAGRLFLVFVVTLGVALGATIVLKAGFELARGRSVGALLALVPLQCLQSVLMGWQTSLLASSANGLSARRLWVIGAAATFCAIAIAAGVLAVVFIWAFWGFLTGCC